MEWKTELKNEWKKITWPTASQLKKRMAAVTFVSVMLGLIISFADSVFQALINFIV